MSGGAASTPTIPVRTMFQKIRKLAKASTAVRFEKVFGTQLQTSSLRLDNNVADVYRDSELHYYKYPDFYLKPLLIAQWTVLQDPEQCDSSEPSSVSSPQRIPPAIQQKTHTPKHRQTVLETLKTHNNKERLERQRFAGISKKKTLSVVGNLTKKKESLIIKQAWQGEHADAPPLLHTQRKLGDLISVPPDSEPKTQFLWEELLSQEQKAVVTDCCNFFMETKPQDIANDAANDQRAPTSSPRCQWNASRCQGNAWNPGFMPFVCPGGKKRNIETPAGKFKQTAGKFKQVCLVGAGGTGKTEVVKALSTFEHFNVVFMTFQHRLLSDVVFRTHGFDNCRLAALLTVAKFIMSTFNLGFISYICEMRFVETISRTDLSAVLGSALSTLPLSPFAGWPDNNVVYIDEFSQINVTVLQLIRDVLRHVAARFGKKIYMIVSGDDKQLPPINTVHEDNSRQIVFMEPTHFVLLKKFRAMQDEQYVAFLVRLELLVDLELCKGCKPLADVLAACNFRDVKSFDFSAIEARLRDDPSKVKFFTFLKHIQATDYREFGLTYEDWNELVVKMNTTRLAQMLIKTRFPNRTPFVLPPLTYPMGLFNAENPLVQLHLAVRGGAVLPVECLRLKKEIVGWWHANKHEFQVLQMIGLRHRDLQNYIAHVAKGIRNSIEQQKDLVTPEVYEFVSFKTTNIFLALRKIYTLNQNCRDKNFYLPLIVGLQYKIEENLAIVSKGEIVTFLGLFTVPAHHLFEADVDVLFQELSQLINAERTGKLPDEKHASFPKKSTMTVALLLKRNGDLVLLKPNRYRTYFLTDATPNFEATMYCADEYTIPAFVFYTSQCLAHIKNSENELYTAHKKFQDKKFVEKTFYGLPMSMACGETIRTVQGLTITDPLIIDLRNSDIFHLYVAFSRARSFSQIQTLLY